MLEDINIERELRIIYMGTPEFSSIVLEGLLTKYKVRAIVTNPDRPVGRTGEIRISKVKEVANNHLIRVIQPVSIKTDYEEVLSFDPDLIITCAYGQFIPKEVLDYPRLGCINVHASLLPRLRGGAPIQRAIMEGHKKTGITIMYMDEKMDSGDVLYQKAIRIKDNDNVGTMFEKLSVLGADMIIDSLPKIISGEIKPIKQNESEVTYAFNISKEDEKIDFNNSSKDIFNKIRGLNPFPVGYSLLDGKRVKIFSSKIGNSNKEGQFGEIINVYKDGIGIKTNDGEIILLEIQIEGKKRTSVKDYLNGLNKDDLIGKIFE